MIATIQFLLFRFR